MGAPGRAARFAVAAAAAFLAGVSLAAVGRWSALTSRATAEIELRRAADQLGAAMTTALAAAQTRADTLSASPIVRAAIAGDASIARDLARSAHGDNPLRPRAGEELELFQSSDGKYFSPLLHAPSFAPPGASPAFVRADDDDLIVAASAPVEPLFRQNALAGAVTVAVQLPLAPLRARLAARGLNLETPSTAAPGVAHAAAPRPASAARVSAAVRSSAAPLTLTATLACGGARALVAAGRAALLFALGFALAALFSLGRIRASVASSDASPEPAAPAEPSSLFVSIARFSPPRLGAQPSPSPISRKARSRAPTVPDLPRRASRAALPFAVPVAGEASIEMATPPPNVPTPVPAELTAKEAPRARNADDAPTRELVLAWSAQNPTPITRLAPLSLPSVPMVIDARAELLDDRYRIIQLLGQGRAAEVFLARPRATNAPTVVALRLLSRSMGPAALERQLAAARRQQALTHPNVARVLDVGMDDPPYIAMEYVEGCNLEQLCLALGIELMPASQSVTLVLALCAALEAALAAMALHHGAVKARNVLVGRHDSIKLADFGAPGAPGDRLAPEQHAGQPGDARSDVYALGVLLHELLTGERVYPVDAREQRWPKLTPPSQRRAGLPRALDALIARATCFNPSDRHHHAGAFGRELMRLAGSIRDTPSRLGDFVERARRGR